MKLSKPPRKKAKVADVNTPFKPPASQKAEVIDLSFTSDCSQQQEDSQTLEAIKPNGSKVDSKKKRVDESPSMSLEEDSSENSADAQDLIMEEDEMIRIFRQECRDWLLDHGKAFFHVDALAFLREQHRKDIKAKEAPPKFGGGFSSRSQR